MASPITFKNVTVPSLDTSNIGAAAGRITDSLGSIGTGIDSLSQGVQSNFAVRQANAARDIQRKIRQDQTANRANTLFGLKGLEDSDIARSLGLGVNKAGNLSFGETQSDAQLSTPENLARIEKAFGGARPDLVEQFAPNDPNRGSGQASIFNRQKMAENTHWFCFRMCWKILKAFQQLDY